MLNVDSTESSEDLDGDDDTLSILGRIFNKAMTPPPDALAIPPQGASELNAADPELDAVDTKSVQTIAPARPGPSGQNAVDTESGFTQPGPSKLNAVDAESGRAESNPDNGSVEDGSDAVTVSPDPDPDLVSPPKGRGHRYVII